MALANYGFQTTPSKTDFSQGSEYVSVQTSFYFFSLLLLLSILSAVFTGLILGVQKKGTQLKWVSLNEKVDSKFKKIDLEIRPLL